MRTYVRRGNAILKSETAGSFPTARLTADNEGSWTITFSILTLSLPPRSLSLSTLQSYNTQLIVSHFLVAITGDNTERSDNTEREREVITEIEKR